MLILSNHCSLQIKSSAQELLNLIDDCERLILRSFDGIKQSAMHIYHSALSWAPTSSCTRILYKHEMVNEIKLLNAVGTTWDACIRIFSMGETVQTIVFSQKGALIAACGDHSVKIFDTMTGANRVTFHKDASISSTTFSPDDNFVAIGNLNGILDIWDVQTGTLFQTFNGNMYIYSISFSPGGNMIATGGSNGIEVWNLFSGVNYKSHHHSGAVNSVCWLGEEHIMSGSNDHTVRIWDLQHWTYCSSIFAKYLTPVINVASSQGSILVASADGTQTIYDSQSGDVIHTILSKDLTHCQFSIDKDKILVANKNSGFIWDLATKTQLQSIGYNGDGAMFSPNGTYVASIYGKFLKIWKTHTGHNVQGGSTDLLNEEIDHIFSTPGEQLVAIIFKDGCCKIFNATTGYSSFTFKHVRPVYAWLMDSPKHYYIPKIKIWNAHISRSSRTINDVIHIVTVDEELVCSSQYNICLASAPLEFPCQIYTGWTGAVSFSSTSNGASISVGDDGYVKWWESRRLQYTNWQPIFHVSHNYWTIRSILKRLCKWYTHPGPQRNRMEVVFVPIVRRHSEHGVPRQSYISNKDDEWVLDQCGRRVLWIPPDERPQAQTEIHGRMVIKTASGKQYVILPIS